MAARRPRFVALVELLARRHPDIDAFAAVSARRVLVDGSIVTNPRARVRADAALRVLPVRRLRGDLKLSHGLDTFRLRVAGRVAVDVGASAGGFTTALLARGARRVYAVDAGVGQLTDRLRDDTRVVNLEGHNLGDLDRVLVTDVVDVITVDLSYLALSDAVGQIEVLAIDGRADLVTLVKPTFELRRATLAASDDDLADAIERAARSIVACGWRVIGCCDAPATGRHGAREAFLHATRVTPRRGRPS